MALTFYNSANLTSTMSSTGVYMDTVQAIQTTSTPTFYGLTVSTGTGQITLGTNTVINANSTPHLQVCTIPNIGTGCTFIMSELAQTMNGTKTFSTGIYLPTYGGTPSQFGYYEEYDHVTGWTGPIAPGSNTTCKITRVGRVCTMMIPAITSVGISNASILKMLSPLPNRFCPATECYMEYGLIVDNGVNGNGYFLVREVGSDQKFYFGTNLTGGFSSNTGTTGLLA